MSYSWRKWRLGFFLSIGAALLTAGAGLVDQMSWKSFLAVFCSVAVRDLSRFLSQHPIEEISDTVQIKNPNPPQPK